MVLAYPGASLAATGFHLSAAYGKAGLWFLAVNAGLLASIKPAAWLVERSGSAAAVRNGCAGAACAFAALAWASASLQGQWAPAALAVLGFSSGLIHTGTFWSLARSYRLNPAATVNLAGTFFGSGSFLVCFGLGAAIGSLPPAEILLIVAAGPLAAFLALWRVPAPPLPLASPEVKLGDPRLLMFTVLLFIQFGNEWTLGGWLPVFLIQRLGVSLRTAILYLALYWLALMLGRVFMQWALARWRHGRLLFLSALAAMFGCLLLAVTNNRFGALLGLVLAGGGFASIFPLVAESMGQRFALYDARALNRLFFFALTGGFLAPAFASLIAERWGIRSVMLLPALGAVSAFLLAGTILITRRFSRVSAQL